MTGPVQATYSPAVFDVSSTAAAMAIILTPEQGQDTDERWRRETPYLAEMIVRECKVTERSWVLDYGCGIGRLAKALIERTGCHVVGVDISPNMRQLALRYVASDRFVALSPTMLDGFVRDHGVRFDAALSVWVLQHCFAPKDDIDRIVASLRFGAALFVVNETRRFVPTAEHGWVDDSADIHEMLSGVLPAHNREPLSGDVVSLSAAQRATWAVYRDGMTSHPEV